MCSSDLCEPTPGDSGISTRFDGALYLFASQEHWTAFLADPSRYVPQFGGFCAVGTSFGEKVDADPKTGTVINGKLYVNYNANTAQLFEKDEAGIIRRAEEQWPTVKGDAAK